MLCSLCCSYLSCTYIWHAVGVCTLPHINFLPFSTKKVHPGSSYWSPSTQYFVPWTWNVPRDIVGYRPWLTSNRSSPNSKGSRGLPSWGIRAAKYSNCTEPVRLSTDDERRLRFVPCLARGYGQAWLSTGSIGVSNFFHHNSPGRTLEQRYSTIIITY